MQRRTVKGPFAHIIRRQRKPEQASGANQIPDSDVDAALPCLVAAECETNRQRKRAYTSHRVEAVCLQPREAQGLDDGRRIRIHGGNHDHGQQCGNKMAVQSPVHKGLPHVRRLDGFAPAKGLGRIIPHHARHQDGSFPLGKHVERRPKEALWLRGAVREIGVRKYP